MNWQHDGNQLGIHHPNLVSTATGLPAAISHWNGQSYPPTLVMLVKIFKSLRPNFTNTSPKKLHFNCNKHSTMYYHRPWCTVYTHQSSHAMSRIFSIQSEHNPKFKVVKVVKVVIYARGSSKLPKRPKYNQHHLSILSSQVMLKRPFHDHDP